MDTDASEALRERILQSLRMVTDPELGENLIDLGLVYAVAVDANGNARIEMSTTTRGCPAAGYLRDAVRSAARTVPGVESAEVVLTYDPPWSPDLIGDGIRHKFSFTARGAHR